MRNLKVKMTLSMYHRSSSHECRCLLHKHQKLKSMTLAKSTLKVKIQQNRPTRKKLVSRFKPKIDLMILKRNNQKNQLKKRPMKSKRTKFYRMLSMQKSNLTSKLLTPSPRHSTLCKPLNNHLSKRGTLPRKTLNMEASKTNGLNRSFSMLRMWSSQETSSLVLQEVRWLVLSSTQEVTG